MKAATDRAALLGTIALASSHSTMPERSQACSEAPPASRCVTSATHWRACASGVSVTPVGPLIRVRVQVRVGVGVGGRFRVGVEVRVRVRVRVLRGAREADKAAPLLLLLLGRGLVRVSG